MEWTAMKPEKDGGGGTETAMKPNWIKIIFNYLL